MAEAAQTLIWPTMTKHIDTISFAVESKDLSLMFFYTLRAEQSDLMHADIRYTCAGTCHATWSLVQVHHKSALVAMVCDSTHFYFLTRWDYSPMSKLANDTIQVYDITNPPERLPCFTVRQRVQTREAITIALGKTLVYVLDGVDWSVRACKSDGELQFTVSLGGITHQDSNVCLRSSSSDDFIILENNLRLQAISAADSSVLWTFVMPKKGVFKGYFGYGMFVEINDRKISILDMKSGKLNQTFSPNFKPDRT